METKKFNESQLIDCVTKDIDNNCYARRDANGIRVFTPNEITFLESLMPRFTALVGKKKAQLSSLNEIKAQADIKRPIYKKNIIENLRNFGNRLANVKNDIQNLESDKANAQRKIDQYNKLNGGHRTNSTMHKMPNFFVLLLLTTIGLDVIGFLATLPIQQQALSSNEILERFFFLIGVLMTSTILHYLYKKSSRSFVKYCLIFTLIMSVVNVFHVVIFSISDSISAPEQTQTIIDFTTAMTPQPSNAPSLLQSIWAAPGLVEFLLCVLATVLGLASMLRNNANTKPQHIIQRSYIEEQLDFWTREYSRIANLIADKENEERYIESEREEYKNGIRARLNSDKMQAQIEKEKDDELEICFSNLYNEASSAINNQYIPKYTEILKILGMPSVDYAECTTNDIQLLFNSQFNS